MMSRNALLKISPSLAKEPAEHGLCLPNFKAARVIKNRRVSINEWKIQGMRIYAVSGEIIDTFTGETIRPRPGGHALQLKHGGLTFETIKEGRHV